MRDPLHWLDVKTKLALTFIAICLLGFGLGGYTLFTHSQATLESEIRQRTESQSRAIAVALDAGFRMLTRRTEDFASDGYIRSHMEQIAADAGGENHADLVRPLHEHVERNMVPLEDAFLGVTLVGTTAEGPVITPPGIPVDAVRSVVASAVRRGGSCTSGLIRVPEDIGHGPAVLAITTSLRSLDGEREIGHLVSWVRPAVWIAAAFDQGELRSTDDKPPGFLSLVDEFGSELRVAPALLGPRAPSADSALLRGGFGLTLPTRGGHGSASDSKVHSFPIASSGMTARVRGRLDDVRRAVAALQGRFLAVGGVLALAVGVLLFFPMRFLARPLLRMKDAAKRLSAGDFSTRVGVEGTDEIGQLGHAFDLMASAVEERTSRLEHTASDLRERQAELRRESDRLAAVISSMRDGLVVLDPDGEPVLVNDAAESLMSILDGMGGASSHGPCGEMSTTSCARCLFEPTAPPRTCTLDIGKGVYEVRATRLTPGEDGCCGRVLVARDVTARIVQDEREIHQERLAVLGEVAAVMAHELNNPLTSISMFSQMMEDEVDPESSLAENIAVVRRNTESCRRTICDLLDYATNADPEIAPIDVHAVLEDASRFLRPVCERAGVRLHLALEAARHHVLGDEVQLRQIFVNLVVNAIQAMHESGGDVWLTTADVDDEFEIFVRDTGTGIPEDVREHVFKPFYTTKARGEGTGLGLSTSRRLAEIHGGGLDVVESSGAGTTLRVRLRIHSECETPV